MLHCVHLLGTNFVSYFLFGKEYKLGISELTRKKQLLTAAGNNFGERIVAQHNETMKKMFRRLKSLKELR